MNRDPITMQMSEARLNDLVYMILKGCFFEPAGLGQPRECDIRVCMNLAVPASNTRGVMAAVLLPDEQAPNSHTVQYSVDFQRVFDECLTYLEEHWLKQTLEQNSENPQIRQEMWDWCVQPGGIFEVSRTLPEAECCSPVNSPPEP